MDAATNNKGMRAPPSGLPNSILNKVSSISFYRDEGIKGAHLCRSFVRTFVIN